MLGPRNLKLILQNDTRNTAGQFKKRRPIDQSSWNCQACDSFAKVMNLPLITPRDYLFCYNPELIIDGDMVTAIRPQSIGDFESVSG